MTELSVNTAQELNVKFSGRHTKFGVYTWEEITSRPLMGDFTHTPDLESRYLNMSVLESRAYGSCTYSGNSAKAHEFTRGMKRVSFIGRPPEGWPVRGPGKPSKAAVRPGSHTGLAQNAGIRPANSRVGMPVCDGAGLWPAEPHDFSRGRSQCAVSSFPSFQILVRLD